MSVWEFRQLIESAIPVWIIFVLIIFGLGLSLYLQIRR